MNRWLVPMIALAATCLLAAAATLLILAGRAANEASVAASGGASQPEAADPGFDGMRFPDFALVDQDGRPVTENILVGRVTIVDFMFTHCPAICPRMSYEVQQLNEKLAGTGVRFMSVSVDPEHDTPAVLKKYAQNHNADPSRWTFLTGDFATVERVLRNGLKFEVQHNPEQPLTLEDGSSMPNIVHPSQLILVGPDRQVLALYRYDDASQLEALAARARAIDLKTRR
jgi:protein SCO1/2